MKKSRRQLHIIFRPEPGGSYTASVPALPGCVTYGTTLQEAKELVKDAIAGYIESLKKHGEPIPTDDESLVTTLDLEYGETTRR
jgi:predicted RNase H-like HicB family nuclease